MRQHLRIMHGDAIEFVAVGDLGELPHDLNFHRCVSLQLWRSVGASLAELAIEQLHQCFNSVTAAQMLCKYICGIYFPSDFPQFYSMATHFFLYP